MENMAEKFCNDWRKFWRNANVKHFEKTWRKFQKIFQYFKETVKFRENCKENNWENLENFWDYLTDIQTKLWSKFGNINGKRECMFEKNIKYIFEKLSVRNVLVRLVGKASVMKVDWRKLGRYVRKFKEIEEVAEVTQELRKILNKYETCNAEIKKIWSKIARSLWKLYEINERNWGKLKKNFEDVWIWEYFPKIWGKMRKKFGRLEAIMRRIWESFKEI